MGTSFGAKISGIVRVDKRYLWLVNGCLEYHRPIITSACPLKRSQTSLRPKLVPISPTRFWSWEFKKLIHLIIQHSSIYWFAGSENNATTGMTASRDLKTELTNRRPAKWAENLLDTERACFASVVFECFTRFFATLCLPKVGKSIWYRFAASNYKHINSSFISEVMLLICTKSGQVNFNLHLQDHISVIQKIIMGSWQFLRSQYDGGPDKRPAVPLKWKLMSNPIGDAVWSLHCVGVIKCPTSFR